MNGEFIEEFDNCVIAAQNVNSEDGSCLRKCAVGKYRFYKGFLWSFDRELTDKQIYLANSPIKRTKEAKLKMSISAINRTDQRKPIIQMDLEGNFIKEWESTSEMVKILGFSNGQISDCLNGKSRQARGFKWKFKN